MHQRAVNAHFKPRTQREARSSQRVAPSMWGYKEAHLQLCAPLARARAASMTIVYTPNGAAFSA